MTEDVEYPPVEAMVPAERAPEDAPVMTSAPGAPGPLPHEVTPEEGAQGSALHVPSSPSVPPRLHTSPIIQPPNPAVGQ